MLAKRRIKRQKRTNLGDKEMNGTEAHAENRNEMAAEEMLSGEENEAKMHLKDETKEAAESNVKHQTENDEKGMTMPGVKPLIRSFAASRGLLLDELQEVPPAIQISATMGVGDCGSKAQGRQVSMYPLQEMLPWARSVRFCE
mmetsp:Transcript_3702/g.14081  ORF Transcript_3702/g.14081 Transcript_3702/m.14081 type:complete len:143 (-) Transcript_3702:712-1140(-)